MNDGSFILHVHTPGADPRFSAGQRVGKGVGAGGGVAPTAPARWYL